MAVREVDVEKLYEDLMAFDEYLEAIEATASTSPTDDPTDDPTGRLLVSASLASNGQTSVAPCVVEDEVLPQNTRPLDGNKITEMKNTMCTIVQSTIGQILILIVYSFLGAALLNFTESYQEQRNTEELVGIKKSVITDIINNVNNATNASTSLDEGSVVWKTVDELLMTYVDSKESLRPYPKSPGWSYWGALFFCGTVYTTVGYGNVYPLTTEGRVITIIYAIIGIPLCLVVLMNLGKTFTHAIKYLWSFVRRFYYTGSCRRVRCMIPAVRLRMTVFQRFKYSLRRSTYRFQAQHGAFRRRPQAPDEALEKAPADDVEGQEFVPYEVDDTFNLPPIVAMIIAFVYMLLGSLLYSSWESWSYFESFYFVFVSFSTIGFGDVVPQHPKFFLLTAIYLFIGLAVVAMVINVCMEVMHVSISKATGRVLAAKLPRPRRGVNEETVQKIVKHLQLSSSPPPASASDGDAENALKVEHATRRKSV